MSIGDIVRHSLRYAWTCKSLWAFGFVVGLAAGGSSGSGSGGSGGQAGGAVALPLAVVLANLQQVIIPLAIAILVLGLAAVLVHFISEGALIEGIQRARQGGPLSFRDGMRAGWAHWGVLFRISLLYFAMVIGSLIVLAAPVVLAFRGLGIAGGIFVAIPSVAAAVPWLITLHLLQAFATRIAVFENRHAVDALRKSRLFLHGRVMHGLKLIVAAFVGTLVIAIPTIIVMVAIVIPIRLLMPVVSFTWIVLACLALIPVGFVCVAVLGTFRSSVWTVGYLTEVES